MPATSETRSPNERLAEIIAAALTGAGLVPANRLDELKRKLANGTAKAEDWRHWIESAQRQAQRKERDDE